MPHCFQHITDLCEICYRSGIKQIVISPGSRNAPLIEAFYSRYGDHCYSIVDERSAGYFALGLARYSQDPVAIICTSGTAVLNLSPAVAEAYYSQVPLLILTADRPEEWIDQQDNQTIRQKEVYRNFSKKSYHLPEQIENDAELKAIHDMIFDALFYVDNQPKGPVHINIPLREPLYCEFPDVSKNISFNRKIGNEIKNNIPDEFIEDWKEAENVLIVHGQDHPASGVGSVLNDISMFPGVVVLAENISNTYGDNIISQSELYFSRINTNTLIPPDLLLYSGGQVVSKKLKNYLRNLKGLNTWRIGTDDYKMDTFKQNNRIVSANACEVYNRLSEEQRRNKETESFKKIWAEGLIRLNIIREKRVKELAFSEIAAVKIILDAIPGNTILELGNSSIVRFFQFFNTPQGVEVFSNRGVSGIDGCISAASGTAEASGKLTISVVGDLSFVYDSNSLWNCRLSPNLRVIIMNNRGGGIFSLLDGPSSKMAYEKYFIAYHPVNLQKLAEAYNLNYFCVKSRETLIEGLHKLLQPARKAGIMEIQTDQKTTLLAYRKMIEKPDSAQSL